MMLKKVEDLVQRVLSNKEKERQNKVIEIDCRPYPWFSQFLRKLDLAVPEGIERKTFAVYSLHVGLYIWSIQGARPEFLYKAEYGHIEYMKHPITKKK